MMILKKLLWMSFCFKHFQKPPRHFDVFQVGLLPSHIRALLHLAFIDTILDFLLTRVTSALLVK